MLEVRFDYDQIKRLEKALGDKSSKLPKEMALAINATARKVNTNIAKEISKELNATQKVIKAQLKIMGRAKPSSLNATVRLQYGRRIPLRDFGARQGKAGTTYKVSKTNGRKLARSAFQGPRPGAVLIRWKGRVFKRTGKARLPIVQLFGASPWGVHVYNKHGNKTKKDASEELYRQMERRIRFQEFKTRNAMQ